MINNENTKGEKRKSMLNQLMILNKTDHFKSRNLCVDQNTKLNSDTLGNIIIITKAINVLEVIYNIILYVHINTQYIYSPDRVSNDLFNVIRKKRIGKSSNCHTTIRFGYTNVEQRVT